MNSQSFAELVVQPNLDSFLRDPGSLRLAINAYTSIDAYVGVHTRCVHGTDNRDLDKDIRCRLADVSEAYRVVRDASFSIKHGFLTPHPKKVPPRVISDVWSIKNVDALWSDDSNWDDTLVWSDDVVALTLSELEVIDIRADVVAREAWRFCSSFLDCKEPIARPMQELRRLGVLNL